MSINVFYPYITSRVTFRVMKLGCYVIVDDTTSKHGTISTVGFENIIYWQGTIL